MLLDLSELHTTHWQPCTPVTILIALLGLAQSCLTVYPVILLVTLEKDILPTINLFQTVLYSILHVYMCNSMVIIDVGRTLIIRLPQKQFPPHWLYYTSISYIAAKTQSSVLMQVYLWSTNNHNVSWPISGCHGPWQGMKPASGKIAYSSYYSYYLSCNTDQSMDLHVDTAL